MQIHNNVILQNEYQSSKLCEAAYTRCEDKMDQLQVLRLPSLAKFNAGSLQCNHSIENECVGPAKTNYQQRMMKVWYDNCIMSFCTCYLWFTIFCGSSRGHRNNFLFLFLVEMRQEGLKCFNDYADVEEVSVSIYKGVQPQAFQLVGGLLPGYGCDWALYYKVRFDWNWSMDTLYISRDLH